MCHTFFVQHRFHTISKPLIRKSYDKREKSRVAAPFPSPVLSWTPYNCRHSVQCYCLMPLYLFTRVSWWFIWHINFQHGPLVCNALLTGLEPIVSKFVSFYIKRQQLPHKHTCNEFHCEEWIRSNNIFISPHSKRNKHGNENKEATSVGI